MKSIEIWPAIDLLGGKCVRLTEGVYGSEKVYSEDPVSVALGFEKSGLKNLHIVDLDGAKSGRTPNLDLIKKIVKKTNLKIQVGGGIRSIDTAQGYFDMGVSRTIVGSAGFKDPGFLEDLLGQFGTEKIVLGLDVRKNDSGVYEVYVNGWESNSGINAEEFLSKTSARNILMTDIFKDGKLEGPNFEMYKYFVQRFPEKNFITSGGISGIEDIHNLSTQEVIVGKALYEGLVGVSELASFQESEKG